MAQATRTRRKPSTPALDLPLGKQRIRAAVLVKDFSLYPRHDLNTVNLHRISQALASGRRLPPVVVDAASLRIVDGFHRVTVALQANPDAEIEADLRSYEDERALFLEAIALNAPHGQPLSPIDHAHTLLIGERLRITAEDIATALAIPIATLDRIKVSRQAVKSDGKTKVNVKRSLRHLAGHVLTPEQESANEKASGWSVAFHADQIVTLIEADAIDWTEDRVRDAFGRLKAIICELDIP